MNPRRLADDPGFVLIRKKLERLATSALPASTSPEPVCALCNGTGWVRRDAQQWEPDFGKIEMCSCLRPIVAARRFEAMREKSRLGKLAHLTFETFQPKAPGVAEVYRAVRGWASEPSGWLVLAGGVGAGKTHLAAAAGHALLGRRRRVVFQVVPDMLDELRGTFERHDGGATYENLFEAIVDAEVLILDDYGDENATPWAREKLFQIVNNRYNARAPMLVTTNRVPESLDQRVWSRLRDGALSRVFHVAAADWRARKGKK